MSRALALAGPRATKSQVTSFHDPQAELKVLTSAGVEQVTHTLHDFQPEIVLVFGGDGTVNFHLSQLANTNIPVLIVPAGSGNDLARVAGTDSMHRARLAWSDFLAGKRILQPSDLGLISSPNLRETRYFSCCANVGLDADAARRTDAMPDWVKSHGGYFIGGLMALANYEPQTMTLRSHDREHIEPGWFVSVSNTPTFGGGLKIAPHASVTDGQLDVTFVPQRRFSRASLAAHFPKILNGKHVGIRGLSLFPAKTLAVKTERSSPVYADGEYVTETPCKIEVAPGALQLITAAVL